MATHSLSLRGELKVARGLTIPLVLQSLEPFLKGFNCTPVKVDDVGNGALVLFKHEDDTLSLSSAKVLRFNLVIWSDDEGATPSEVAQLCVTLEQMLREPAHIEILDHEAALGSSTAITPRFLGRNADERAQARVAYGMAKAKDWLMPAIGAETFESLRSMACLGATRAMADAAARHAP